MIKAIWDLLCSIFELLWIGIKGAWAFVKWLFDKGPNGMAELVAVLFSPQSYEERVGRDDRFPSVLSPIFCFLCKHLLFVYLIIFIVVAATKIAAGVSILNTILSAVLLTVWYHFVGTVLFMLLIGIEAFAKLFACLIIYGELPTGAENAIDAFILELSRKGSF